MTNVSYTLTPYGGTSGVSSTWQSLHGSDCWLLLSLLLPWGWISTTSCDSQECFYTQNSAALPSPKMRTRRSNPIPSGSRTREEAWLSSRGTITNLPESHQRETENTHRPSSCFCKWRILVKQLPPKHGVNSLQPPKNSNAFFQNYLNSCRRTKD